MFHFSLSGGLGGEAARKQKTPESDDLDAAVKSMMTNHDEGPPSSDFQEPCLTLCLNPAHTVQRLSG
eukprot:6260777-Amphidinium_carterae.1